MNRKSESEENLDDMEVVPQGGPNKDDSLSELGQMCMRTEVSKAPTASEDGWVIIYSLFSSVFYNFIRKV